MGVSECLVEILPGMVDVPDAVDGQVTQGVVG